MILFFRSWLRITILTCTVFTLFSITYIRRDQVAQHGVHNRALSAQQTLLLPDTKNPREPFQRLDLDEQHCRSSFPHQFHEIDTAMARGRFKFEKSDPDYQGFVQARILNNNLLILTTSPDTLPQILHQRTSILSQIHRALITSPAPLANTYFSFAINDVPKNTSWGFSRPNKPSNLHTWPMPSFASWSWPKSHLGTMDTVIDRITRVENNTPFAEKTDKLVWRGTPFFNPLGYPHLRQSLIAATRDKSWADVEALDAAHVLNMEEFCKYKYIMYTEGVTYSGRLPYHQVCESVLITAPLSWVTTSAGLMRPIWAEDLMRKAEKRILVDGILPTVSAFEDANAIYVEPDFSNLERLIEFLRTRPDIAQRIARNQRRMVFEGGYLSLAAETCYWRGLIHAWGKVAVVHEDDWRNLDGQRYETWLLNETSAPRGGIRGRMN